MFQSAWSAALQRARARVVETDLLGGSHALGTPTGCLIASFQAFVKAASVGCGGVDVAAAAAALDGILEAVAADTFAACCVACLGPGLAPATLS